MKEKVINFLRVLRSALYSSANNDSDKSDEVLDALYEILPETPEPTPPTPPTPSEILDAVTVTSSKAYANIQVSSGLTKGAACEALGISSADLDALMAGNILRVKFNDVTGSFVSCMTNGTSVKIATELNAETEGASLDGLMIGFEPDEGIYEIDHLI